MLRAGKSSKLALDVLDLLQDASSTFKQKLARRRQHNASGVSDQQLDAQALLQLADLQTEGRLRDLQLLGSLSDIAELGDADEITKLPEINQFLPTCRDSQSIMERPGRVSKCALCQIASARRLTSRTNPALHALERGKDRDTDEDDEHNGREYAREIVAFGEIIDELPKATKVYQKFDADQVDEGKHQT